VGSGRHAGCVRNWAGECGTGRENEWLGGEWMMGWANE
jgi:hypothetical protein